MSSPADRYVRRLLYRNTRPARRSAFCCVAAISPRGGWPDDHEYFHETRGRLDVAVRRSVASLDQARDASSSQRDAARTAAKQTSCPREPHCRVGNDMAVCVPNSGWRASIAGTRRRCGDPPDYLRGPAPRHTRASDRVSGRDGSGAARLLPREYERAELRASCANCSARRSDARRSTEHHIVGRRVSAAAAKSGGHEVAGLIATVLAPGRLSGCRYPRGRPAAGREVRRPVMMIRSTGG
jgi:hypothetical protein